MISYGQDIAGRTKDWSSFLDENVFLGVGQLAGSPPDAGYCHSIPTKGNVFLGWVSDNWQGRRQMPNIAILFQQKVARRSLYIGRVATRCRILPFYSNKRPPPDAGYCHSIPIKGGEKKFIY
jgi:hypothetical protein